VRWVYPRLQAGGLPLTVWQEKKKSVCNVGP
jgi:hypothetical protein